jgi:hypothetical protein
VKEQWAATLISQYRGVRKILRRYWHAYGGWSSLLLSPYLHVSAGLTLLLYVEWAQPGWWRVVFAVLPGIIGFSLGGYAILLAFGDSRFQQLLMGKGEDGDPSPYMKVNATFVHFITVQIGALLLALSGKATFSLAGDAAFLYWFWGFGYGSFIYALSTAVAATMQVLRLAYLYDLSQAANPSGQASTAKSNKRD